MGQRTHRHVVVAVLFAAAAGLAQAPGGGEPCPGDCDANGTVAVEELIVGVGIALAIRSVDQCEAMDGDVDGAVSVAELLAAVNRARDGCVQEPCGDPLVAARFSRCQASETEARCLEAGGTWGPYPFSRIPGCFCPTGQGGCPCDDPGDCNGVCITDGDPFGDRFSNACAAATRGACTAREPTAGCFCAFIFGDVASGICIDP